MHGNFPTLICDGESFLKDGGNLRKCLFKTFTNKNENKDILLCFQRIFEQEESIPSFTFLTVSGSSSRFIVCITAAWSPSPW